MDSKNTVPEQTSDKAALPAVPSSKLILRQGMVRVKGDAPSGEYLRAWQMKHGYQDGTPIRILTDEDYRKLFS